MRRELICTAPTCPPSLRIREVALPVPGRGEVLVRVNATAINPIDVKRAGGYGQRLLKLKGAGTFPLVLGNDFAGRVEAIGPDVSTFAVGQPVFGLVGTGKQGGAQASHLVVPQAQLLCAPPGADDAALAVLPYSFTTMWQALRGAGLSPANAPGKRVLVHGAAGALGRLSLATLSAWGCEVTAVCAIGKSDECRALGAQQTVERSATAIGSLPAVFDVTLNFADWNDDRLLVSRLNAQALGHATTVHPLLGNFDRLGWLRGALTSRRDFAASRNAVRQRAAGARYAWTIFKPDRAALEALASGLGPHRLMLPVGLRVPLDQADAAFAHAAAGAPGRAVLMP